MTSSEVCGIIKATRENIYSIAFENADWKSEAPIWVSFAYREAVKRATIH